jgi:predicted secreted protein
MPSKRSRTGRPATPTTSYAEWKDRAEVKLERRHGVKASTIPARLWTKLYVRNLSPEAAAAEAATSAYNTRPAFDRLGSGKKP